MAKKNKAKEEGISRKRLVVAAKDMQEVMGLEDDSHKPTFTDSKVEKMDSDELAEEIMTSAKEIRTEDDKEADKDVFEDDTWAVLKELGEREDKKEKEEKKEETPVKKKEVKKLKETPVKKKEVKKIKETKKEKKSVKKTDRHMGIGTFVIGLLKKKNHAKSSNQELVTLVKAEFPDANTTAQNIAWYRNKIQRDAK